MLKPERVHSEFVGWLQSMLNGPKLTFTAYDDRPKRVLAVSFVLSAALALLVGVLVSQLQWQRAQGALQASLQTAFDDLNTLVADGASYDRVQSVLNGVAAGAGLDWLAFRAGEQRWDILALETHSIADVSGEHEIAVQLAGTRNTLKTRVLARALYAVDWPIAFMTFVLLIALNMRRTLAALRALAAPTPARLRLAPSLSPASSCESMVSRSRCAVRNAWNGLKHSVNAKPITADGVPLIDNNPAWEILRLRQQYADLLHDTAEKVRRAERKSTLRHIVEKVSHE
ncbi:MAG: hypothetical protein AAF499_12150, partial [Pseudomonadota bacterium]